MSETLRVPRVSVHFTFTITDGWPPVAGETVWATELGNGTYLVDNIPFFALNIALNDTIEARPDPQGGLEFVRKIAGGGHSTLRIIAERVNHQMMKKELAGLGCGFESGIFDSHFAIDVPPSSNLQSALTLCKKWLAEGIAEYETGCLQQAFR